MYGFVHESVEPEPPGQIFRPRPGLELVQPGLSRQQPGLRTAHLERQFIALQARQHLPGFDALTLLDHNRCYPAGRSKREGQFATGKHRAGGRNAGCYRPPFHGDKGAVTVCRLCGSAATA